MVKLFRDVATGHLLCNVDDVELYRSVDDGANWERLAGKDEFAWKVDANNRVHVAWHGEVTPVNRVDVR